MTPKMVVLKYPLTAAIGDITRINVPESARIVHGGLDPSGQICVWIEMEVGHKRNIELRFTVRKTGEEFPYPARHVATFVREWFVGHIYEV